MVELTVQRKVGSVNMAQEKFRKRLSRYPIVVLCGISPKTFLDVRNYVVECGFIIREWSYERDERWGGVQIDGFRKADKEVGFAQAVRLTAFQERMRALLEMASQRAEVAFFANSVESFQVYGDEECLVTPAECVARFLKRSAEISPVCRISR